MPFQPPPWVTPEEAEYHGNAFCCCFDSKAHWDHYLATGDIRKPASARRQAALKANPMAAHREYLRHRADNAKRGMQDAERRIEAARAEIASSPYLAFRAEQTLKEQLTRLEERAGALKCAEVDLALYDEMHS